MLRSATRLRTTSVLMEVDSRSEHRQRIVSRTNVARYGATVEPHLLPTETGLRSTQLPRPRSPRRLRDSSDLRLVITPPYAPADGADHSRSVRIVLLQAGVPPPRRAPRNGLLRCYGHSELLLQTGTGRSRLVHCQHCSAPLDKRIASASALLP